MRTNVMRRLQFSIAFVLGVLLLATVAPVSCYIWAQVQTGEGDEWLSKASEARLGFVSGYIIGMSRGFADGCDTYRRIAPQVSRGLRDDLFGKCLNSSDRGFSRPADLYEKRITEFYSSFPSDRRIPFEKVLKALSDSENKTPEQMHEMFRERPHTVVR
jgi:hypothetical protein